MGSVSESTTIPPVESASALVTFLRCEADMADERARRLRAQADQLAMQYGVDSSALELMVVDPEDMAPLDENGIPKYKGKKRGRKPKKRKRMKDPDRPKRQHTAYTLFVQETYPTIRQNNPELPSKDVISIVARQWAEVNELEKKAWKARALSSGAGTTNAVEDESSKAVGGASTALVETHDKEAKEAAAVAAAAATAAGDVVVHGLEVEESEDDEEEEEEDDEEEEEQDETTLTTTAEETTRRKRRVTRNKAR